MGILKFFRGKNQKGQSTMEYAAFIILFLGALVATQVYIKRGVQGRWQTASDDFGDQFDPLVADSSVTHSVRQNTTTSINVSEVEGGYETERTDTGVTEETRTGSVTVGAY